MVEIQSPMPGKVIEVKVKSGSSVIEGEELVILEAMKMEMPIVATGPGTVKEVMCIQGNAVDTGAILVVLE